MKLGVPAQQLAADRAARRGEQPETMALGVAPQLWPAVRLFKALCMTQWLGGPQRSQRTGLRYESIPAVVRMLRLRLRPRLLEQLQVMEAEALGVFSAEAAAS